MARIDCCCCGRQILLDRRVGDNYVAPGPAYRMVGSNYTCGECGKELDENGLFPEERGEALFVAKIMAQSDH